jgi:Protein of unknown function (DUF1488)
MPLNYVRELNADFGRQLFRFLVSDGEREFVCAVSYTALDDEDRAHGETDRDRSRQFERHQVRIMDAASHKYYGGQRESGADPVVMVMRADLEGMPR